jgi:hypothetical protein
MDGVFYLELFRALQAHEVRYLVVGGLAVNLYGVERATMDVDLMLAMDTENLTRFIRAARGLGLTPVPPVQLESLAEEETRTEAWSHRVEKSVAGLTVQLACLDDLIRMKASTGRQRDRSDIEALEKARRIADDGKD